MTTTTTKPAPLRVPRRYLPSHITIDDRRIAILVSRLDMSQYTRLVRGQQKLRNPESERRVLRALSEELVVDRQRVIHVEADVRSARQAKVAIDEDAPGSLDPVARAFADDAFEGEDELLECHAEPS